MKKSPYPDLPDDALVDKLKNRQELVRLNPDNPGVHYNLAVVHSELGQMDEAMRIWQHVLTLNPLHCVTNYNMGIQFGREGRHEEAIERFKKCLELEPETEFIRIALGDAYLNAGHNKEAMATFRKILPVSSEPGRIYVGIGIAYTRMEQYDKAIQTYKKAIRESPSWVDLYFELGKVFLITKGGEAGRVAREFKEKKMHECLTDPETKYFCALAFVALGMKKEAKEILASDVKGVDPMLMREADELIKSPKR